MEGRVNRVPVKRKEFPLGPNAGYLASLFHVLQVTGNDALGPVIEDVAAKRPSGQAADRRPGDAGAAGQQSQVAVSPSSPGFSAGHTGVPYANFTRNDIERALAVADPLSR